MCQKYDCGKEDCPLCDFLKSLPETAGYYNSPEEEEECRKMDLLWRKERDDGSADNFDYCYDF
jgi:hypothetical protein